MEIPGKAAGGMMQDPQHGDKGIEVSPAAGSGSTDRGAWVTLAAGFLAAFIAVAIPMSSLFFNFIRTFIHEFGHAMTCWFFAHPATPYFDIATGGGVTAYDDRNNMLLAVYVTALLVGLFLYRRNRLTLGLLSAGAVAYATALATQAHEVLILLMGHGAELLVAGLLIYRVFADERIVGKLRRPAFAFTGLFILLQMSVFTYRLSTSDFFRRSYEGLEGGAGFEMDFSHVSKAFLGMDVKGVATAFLVLTLLVPVAGYGCHRYRHLLLPARDRLGARHVGER